MFVSSLGQRIIQVGENKEVYDLKDHVCKLGWGVEGFCALKGDNGCVTYPCISCGLCILKVNVDSSFGQKSGQRTEKCWAKMSFFLFP